MTSPTRNNSRHRGFTLVEITTVIAAMLLLASIIAYSLSSMTEWKKGKSASEDLKAVYLAQKGYLADHPTEDAGDLTAAKVIPYLPGRPGALPTAKSLADEDLTVDVTVMPPVYNLSGSAYDPSAATDDGVWDAGGL